jgi:hypothetical protein
LRREPGMLNKKGMKQGCRLLEQSGSDMNL